MELLYNLMTFGIPRNAFPVDPFGSVETKSHLNWLKAKRKQEAMAAVHVIPADVATLAKGDGITENKASESSLIPVPKRMDVLLGRGKVIQEHPGNLRYRHLIETSRERYERSSKFEKTAVAEVIVRMIKESNGRFSKQDDDGTGWVVVSDEIAREKVAHAFRNRRKVKNGGSKAAKAPKRGDSVLSIQSGINKRQDNPNTFHAGNSWMAGAMSMFGLEPVDVTSAKRSRFG